MLCVHICAVYLAQGSDVNAQEDMSASPDVEDNSVEEGQVMKSMFHLDEAVTPAALRGFHFDLQMLDEDEDGKADNEVSSLTTCVCATRP